MEIKIRQAATGDVNAITGLSRQLGYPLLQEQILQNLEMILASKDHDAFVAIHENNVIGWIGVARTIMIEMTPYCEINGLVVDDNFRGKGVGKLLIEKAKQWSREKGNHKLRVRCNVKRKETHLFYQHLGFIETKEQKNFEISI